MNRREHPGTDNTRKALQILDDSGMLEFGIAQPPRPRFWMLHRNRAVSEAFFYLLIMTGIEGSMWVAHRLWLLQFWLLRHL